MSVKGLSPSQLSLQELVKHVFLSDEVPKPITYGELARRIGRLNKHGDGHGHGMGHVLAKMGHLLQELEGEWGERVPYIQSLVVNKTGLLRGLPDEGIREFWTDYLKLTKQEKRNRVRIEYQKIRGFGSRWNKVLSAVGLSEISMSSKDRDSTKTRHGSGGESPQHRELKEYVSRHPEIVGAEKRDTAFVEYALPSLDVVDVMFQGPKKWIAVEVKSRISDRVEQDYERGLYQYVKYRAILEAMKLDSSYQLPTDVAVVLLLETKLPSSLRPLAKSLGITIIENVRVRRSSQ